MRKIFLFLCIVSSSIFSQSLDNSHFFLNSIIDAPKATINYVEINTLANSYDNYNKEYLRVEGNYLLNGNISVNASVKMPNVASMDFTPSFITLGSRYSIDREVINLSIGGLIDMKKDFQSSFHYNFAFSVFTALRYNISPKLLLSNSLRLRFSDVFSKYDGIVGLGGIYLLHSKINIIAEMNYSIERDYFQWGGGLEYNLMNKIRIRGGIFQNIENSDYSMQIGLTYIFDKI